MKLKCLVILLVFFLGVVILAYFQPISSYQEARRVLIIKETSEHVFLQTYNGNPYFTKPPLYTWIAIPFYKILSSKPKGDLFSIRLVSILSYLFILIAIYFLLERNFNKFCLTSIILLSNFRFLSFISRIDLEPLFVLFSFLMFCCAYFYFKKGKEFYRVSFYLFLGLSFMVRGPLHLFLIPAFLVYGIIFKEKRVFKLLFYPSGWLITLILILPWYFYGYFYFGKKVFQEFLFVDLGKRLIIHKDPFYYYFKALFLNFILYFILFVWVVLKTKSFKLWKFLKEKEISFIFFSAFIPVLLLSFTGEKFDKYLLYLYPLWAIFFVLVLEKYFSFLKNLALICFILSVVSYFSIQIFKIKDLSYKIDIIKANINPHQKLVFWQDEMPLIIYYYGKPIKVLKNKKKLKSFLEKGYFIISKKPLPGLIDKIILFDPYKKDRIWYFLIKN